MSTNATPLAITFSLDLYAKEAIESAVHEFAELATFTSETRDGFITVNAADPDPELAEHLMDELANYVMHETIVRHRHSPSAQES